MAMTKKQEAPVELHLRIPTDGSGIAFMTATKGEVGKVKQITFGDQNDLAAAIYDVVYELIDMEIQPPPSYEVSIQEAHANQQNAAASQTPEEEPAEEEQVEDAEQPGEEIDEPGEEVEEPLYEDIDPEAPAVYEGFEEASEEEIEKNPGL